jgi:hypothetical protein
MKSYVQAMALRYVAATNQNMHPYVVSKLEEVNDKRDQVVTRVDANYGSI